MQKIKSIHELILKIEQILESRKLNGHAHFWPADPNIIESTFSFPGFAPTWKNQLIIYIPFWDTVNFRVPWVDWSRSFLTMSTQKYFVQVIIYVNLYQIAKNETTLLIGRLVVAGRVLWNRVCPSFRPFVHLGIFLELYH